MKNQEFKIGFGEDGGSDSESGLIPSTKLRHYYSRCLLKS